LLVAFGGFGVKMHLVLCHQVDDITDTGIEEGGQSCPGLIRSFRTGIGAGEELCRGNPIGSLEGDVHDVCLTFTTRQGESASTHLLGQFFADITQPPGF